MARDHARFQTAIWDDPDWLKLDQGAQHLYWMLASHKDLSYCGCFRTSQVGGAGSPMASRSPS